MYIMHITNDSTCIFQIACSPELPLCAYFQQTIKPLQIYLPTAGSESSIWHPLTKFLKPCLYVIEGLSMNFCKLILLERISSNFRSKCLVLKQKKTSIDFYGGKKLITKNHTSITRKNKFILFKLGLFWFFYLN